MSGVTLPPSDLARLLHDAQEGPHYSVRAALALADGQPSPRIAALVAGLTARKRALWADIAAATRTPAPPDDAGLTRLAAWEVQAAGALTSEHLRQRVGGRSVGELLLEHTREALWTAGQIAAQASRVRLA